MIQHRFALEIGRPEWHVDQRTREIGRRGLADARAALEAAARRAAEHDARLRHRAAA